MAKSEMGKKELLEWLYAYKYWSRHLTSPGQYIAYDRLVEIVKEHFRGDKMQVYQQGLADGSMIADEQKPTTVTKEDFERLAWGILATTEKIQILEKYGLKVEGDEKV